MLTLGNNENYMSYKFGIPESSNAPSKSVYREILDNNADRMDSIALIFQQKYITYQQLFDQADKLADILASYGIKKGDMIPIYMR